MVLDSSLVVSAFLNPEGIASTALQLAVEHFDVAASRATLAELADVLKRDKFDRYCAKADRITRLEAYEQTVLVFDVLADVTDCKDPKDNKFLALCITAGAKALVTCDKKDLLVMHPYQNTAVVGLRAFMDGFTAYF